MTTPIHPSIGRRRRMLMLGASALPLAAVIAAMGVLALALALYKRAIGPV